MIIEYHRPQTLNEALSLLSRHQPATYPLGGGTVINQGMEDPIAVVDLQALGLSTITSLGNQLQIGATVTLQQLLEFNGFAEDIYKAIKHEATYNLRQMASIAGTLVAASGRSPFATVMLALNASLEFRALGDNPEQVEVGNWLPMRDRTKPNKLITAVSIPTNTRLSYEYIARTPADQPIVCAAAVQWGSGRTRLALGGWGKSPVLALDGPNSDGIEAAALNAYSMAADEWASADYRQEMAGILATRCMQRIVAGE